ncbi:MAG TPA: UDP-N-acetylmuramate dehydrogenase [Candidatus Avacidaminococcus intestinavium]|uniref:UDP-N-acetylenolpyruvoylglucosamine reductase n=1 Tax=Candidatus Avacidaminococcus intestinavium TaxID=2840684 RepID=A0A9D1SLA0_9FIRM|nr:UDP-N-acetylmuramate dehydrogenase [Candidatus Avacidaminococcus intestinavium]
MGLSTFKKWLKETSPAVYRENEPMKFHTSFKIGGPADVLVLPSTREEVERVVSKVRELELPLTVMGNGSNLLVKDRGIRGVVIKIGNNLRQIRCTGTDLVAEAGASLSAVANQAAVHGLQGLEFAVGIPGSLGGAVFMNAGAYDGEMSKVVSEVTVLNASGTYQCLNKKELAFGYRHSSVQDSGSVILSVVLSLQPGNVEAIKTKMADFTNRRVSKQPLDIPNAGSMFRRPPGYFAGTLIEETGLKGYTVGGAQVSTKHAGFIVNVNNATAEDVLHLIGDVQAKVFAFAGVHLEPEVRVIGE